MLGLYIVRGYHIYDYLFSQYCFLISLGYDAMMVKLAKWSKGTAPNLLTEHLLVTSLSYVGEFPAVIDLKVSSSSSQLVSFISDKISGSGGMRGTKS